MSDHGPRLLVPSVGAPLSTPAPALEPSTQLAHRYRALEEVGRGTMGVVYRAVQTNLNREVALKFPTLETKLAGDRFLREARLLATLSHPNLVRVLDADLDAGRPFLVLELVTGWSLADYRAKQESMSVPEAVGLVCQVLDGLAAAHAAGIVHRDVKSGNVLVSAERVAKVADFGLARVDDGAGLTVAGTLLGTPAYLSPEVAQGQVATAKSDLYAAGVMLFELIAGRLPFTAISAQDLLAKHVHEPAPRLAKFASDIPDELEAAYQQLMAKAPHDRPADAATAGRLLRQAMGLDQSVTALDIPALDPAPAPRPSRKVPARSRPIAAPAPPPERTWAYAIAGFTLALALAAPAAYLATRPPPTPPAPASPPASVLETPASSSRPPSRWTPLEEHPPDASGLVTWTSSTDGAPMVHVPAGPSIRGTNEVGPDERPIRTIHLDEFWIDRFEVTNRLYDRFVAATNHAPRERHPRQPTLDAPDNPVISVTWQDAVDYCLWAGKRLPTEAEWEKAARGPAGNRYPWGQEEPGARTANMADPMGVSPDSHDLTAPVGKFPAGMSPYGAHDMAGNAWEWCSDWYGDKYYADSPDRNPTGPDGGRWRVSRGGSHVSYMNTDLLPSYRKKGEPLARHLDQGFRCVRPGPL